MIRSLAGKPENQWGFVCDLAVTDRSCRDFERGSDRTRSLFYEANKMTKTNETPATFNEYREAFERVTRERDAIYATAMAEAANRRKLAEAVIVIANGDFRTAEEWDSHWNSLVSLAEGMTK